MRNIRSTGLSHASFNTGVRNLARNSPWWTISFFVHFVAALILSSIPMWIEHKEEVSFISADQKQELKAPEQLDEPPPPPPTLVKVDRPDPKLPDDEPPGVPEEIPDPGGDDQFSDAPLRSPFRNSAIGPAFSAGGRKGHGPGRGGGGDGDGNGITDDAVELGLLWLSKHQDRDGRWDCDGFMKHDPGSDRCDGPGGALHDVGVTGLATLAFLGANYTDRGTGRYRKNVRGALRYLMRVQDEDGCLGSRTGKGFMYSHAIGTLALCEAYWMTRNPRVRKPAQDALAFICRSRNPYLAWRYEPRGGKNDTSITGWMVMALKAGRWAGLEIDPDAFEGARQWIEKMTDPEFGHVGYDTPGGGSARPDWLQEKFPAEKSQSMTSVGMLTRIFLGEDPRRSEIIQKGAVLCAELPPKWDPDDGSIDMYYWYYGTLAMFQVGGKHWNTWNRALKRSVVRHQHPKGSGSRTGSWDPIGAWGADGGRVYATAMMTMCLEVYYRYGRVFGSTSR